MVHRKVALFWGAEKNNVPYMEYTAASFNDKPQPSSTMSLILISWLMNIVISHEYVHGASRHFLDIDSPWIGSGA